MRSQMQASEMRFLQTIEGVTMHDKLRNIAIRASLNIASLLLRIERSQLRWFGHESRMPHERLPKQTLYARVSGKRPVGRRRARWIDYIKTRGWNRLRLHLSEIQSVALCWWTEKCGGLIWRCCPRNPREKSGKIKKRKNVKNKWD